MVVAGYEGACAITRDDALYCWGAVAGEKLSGVTRITGLSQVRSVVVSQQNACAIIGNGSVRCWGSNVYGSLGTGSTDALSPGERSTVPGIEDAREVLVDGSTSCALRKTGDVLCWGASNGSQQNRRLAPSPIAGLPKMRRLAGGMRAAGISLDGDVYRWNDHPRYPFEARRSEAWLGVKQFEWGSHSCAIMKDRTVRCFGLPQWGSIGVDPYVPHWPIETVGPHEVTAFGTLSSEAMLAVGGQSTCVLDKGVLRCIGTNQFGQLGIGEMARHAEPYEVPGLDNVRQVMPFHRHETQSLHATCALKDDGKVMCWGTGRSRNDARPEGIERRTDAATPQEIAGLTGVTALLRGARAGEACARRGADLWCFQAGLYAYPGSKTEEARAFVPRRLIGLSNVVDTALITEGGAVNTRSAYAVLSDGSVVAWTARKGSERIQDGELVVNVETKQIHGLSNVSRLIATRANACAVHKDGSVSCFSAYPPFGTWQNQVPDALATRPQIVRVDGIEDAVDIGVDDATEWPIKGVTFYVRKKDGSVSRFWVDEGASNHTPFPRVTASPVPSLAGATAMSHGESVCVARDGAVQCARDRTGKRATGSEVLPFRVETGAVTSVEDDLNVCVLKKNKRVACWGNNIGGALGAPDRDLSIEPLVVEIPNAP
ncbi:MAG: hypothetical protein HOV80_07775 [Polyangiaceae bacterium]|nr:hypothetical protein [Polyangiaceae bacterium]